MYVCICMCMYVCMCVYVYGCVCMCMSMYMCICVCKGTEDGARMDWRNNLLRVRQEGNRMGYVQYNFVRKHHLDVRADLFPITSISEEGTWPDVSIVYEPRFSPQANQTQVGMVTLTCSHLIGLCANSLSKGDRNRPALSHGVRVSWIGFKY